MDAYARCGEVFAPEAAGELGASALQLASVALLPKDDPRLRYALSRATLPALLRWRVCYSPSDRSRLYVPSFGEDGELTYWVARAAVPRVWPKYVNPAVDAASVVFNEIDVDYSRQLTIVEGVFDAMRAGGNVVPLLGSSLDERHALFDAVVANDTPVTLLLDPDATMKAIRIAGVLSSYGVRVKIGLLQSDPGSSSQEACREAVARAQEWSWETKVKLTMDARFGSLTAPTSTFVD